MYSLMTYDERRIRIYSLLHYRHLIDEMIIHTIHNLDLILSSG